jgi:hypothetical protein
MLVFTRLTKKKAKAAIEDCPRHALSSTPHAEGRLEEQFESRTLFPLPGLNIPKRKIRRILYAPITILSRIISND